MHRNRLLVTILGAIFAVSTFAFVITTTTAPFTSSRTKAPFPVRPLPNKLLFQTESTEDDGIASPIVTADGNQGSNLILDSIKSKPQEDEVILLRSSKQQQQQQEESIQPQQQNERESDDEIVVFESASDNSEEQQSQQPVFTFLPKDPDESIVVPSSSTNQPLQRLARPSPTTTTITTTTNKVTLQGRLSRFRAATSKLFRRLRPGDQFRVRLGVAVAAGLSVWSYFVPQKRLLSLLQKWWTSRGFTGLAAIGRSIAYGWAVLVGYPRVLDRRANEQRRQRRDKLLDQRRAQLTRAAAEVSRLRQELVDLDAEIRAFRREIIKMKAYTPDNDDVQEAIGSEMAHLAQLRSDAQAALVAARQAWAEMRSANPTEAWEEDNDTL